MIETRKMPGSLQPLNDPLVRLVEELKSLSLDLQYKVVSQLDIQITRHAKRQIDGGSGVVEDDLSQREEQVLVLLASGYSRKEIGSVLCISLNTAARHVSNIYGKLGVNNMAEATRYAVATGLID